MEEPILKRKSLIDKIIKNQAILTISTAFLLIFVVVGSSYAIFNSNSGTSLNDVIVQSGNLLATISSSSEIIEMDYTTLGVEDEIGLSYDPYTFTVKNSGQNAIKYYELRIVDKEYENSTLPHKSINFSLSKNNGNYTEPQNLGDNRSYIYAGASLESGESDIFNLKMWANEEFGEYANNKNLKVSIELTLYSDIPTRNYIIYDTQGGSFISKTSVSSKRVTNQVPTKNGFVFLGWSTSTAGNIDYKQNDKYEENNGKILYAIWKKVNFLYNSISQSLNANLLPKDGQNDYDSRIVYGDDTIKNYVEFSGVLWRIVSLNNNGTVKLITEDSVATLPWDNADGRDYSTSSIREYLNNEFLNSIDGEMIELALWDYSLTDTLKPDGTLTINDKVGLLSLYEFIQSGSSDGYLGINNNSDWWTITINGFDKFEGAYIITNGGGYVAGEPGRFCTDSLHVKPAINLKKNIVIEDVDGDGDSGDGSLENPYEITLLNLEI